METARYREKLNRLLADHAHAARCVEEEKEKLQEDKESLQAALEAQTLAQTAAEQVQKQAHARLAGVVTHSLAAVMEDPYEFLIEFERRRGKTEATLAFRRDGHVLTNPRYEAGIGSVDIASLALRLSCLMLLRPRKRKLLVMDEPFKNVHGAGNRQRAADLLCQLAKDMEVQMIIATGLEWLMDIGHVVEVGG